jgi:sugar lactone lactonase YvrE
VKAEEVVLTIEGHEWKQGGETPRVHSDGIALSSDRKYLYYQALTGRTLYRVPTAALLDTSLSAKELGDNVETVCETGAADGIEFGRDGYLYLTAIEKNAITRVNVESGRLEMVAIHDNFVWPDSIACHNDGSLYVTTSQINRVSMNSTLSDPFRLFHLQPVQIADWSVPRSSS